MLSTHKRKCAVCGNPLPLHTQSVTCSEECHRKRRQAFARKRYAAKAAQKAAQKRAVIAQYTIPDDPYDGKLLYFDGLHAVRDTSYGADRVPDPVLGF